MIFNSGAHSLENVQPFFKITLILVCGGVAGDIWTVSGKEIGPQANIVF